MAAVFTDLCNINRQIIKKYPLMLAGQTAAISIALLNLLRKAKSS